MDSKTKVFRTHRALAWFYGLSGFGIAAINLIGARGRVNLSLILFICLFALLILVHYATAKACKEGRPGGRTASTAIAILMLFGFPFGTIVGIYLLINTSKPWTAQAAPTYDAIRLQ